MPHDTGASGVAAPRYACPTLGAGELASKSMKIKLRKTKSAYKALHNKGTLHTIIYKALHNKACTAPHGLTLGAGAGPATVAYSPLYVACRGSADAPASPGDLAAGPRPGEGF